MKLPLDSAGFASLDWKAHDYAGGKKIPEMIIAKSKRDGKTTTRESERKIDFKAVYIEDREKENFARGAAIDGP